jgi:hypothetical protein
MKSMKSFVIFSELKKLPAFIVAVSAIANLLAQSASPLPSGNSSAHAVQPQQEIHVKYPDAYNNMLSSDDKIELENHPKLKQLVLSLSSCNTEQQLLIAPTNHNLEHLLSRHPQIQAFIQYCGKQNDLLSNKSSLITNTPLVQQPVAQQTPQSPAGVPTPVIVSVPNKQVPVATLSFSYEQILHGKPVSMHELISLYNSDPKNFYSSLKGVMLTIQDCVVDSFIKEYENQELTVHFKDFQTQTPQILALFPRESFNEKNEFVVSDDCKNATIIEKTSGVRNSSKHGLIKEYHPFLSSGSRIGFEGVIREFKAGDIVFCNCHFLGKYNRKTESSSGS